MSKLGGFGRGGGLAAGLAAGSTLGYGYGGSSTPYLSWLLRPLLLQRLNLQGPRLRRVVCAEIRKY
jgi:hypothetical protein